MAIFDNQTGLLTPQSMLQGRYIIIGQAGRGGMGAVYRAVDTQDNQRAVAIKEMSQSRLNTTELAAATTRFQQEANMLHALSHPNLPHIYNAFSEQGRFYLVMDFIEGKTLQQLLKETNHPLPVLQTLHYAQQLCDVLTYLHQQQPPIIFRDVKPTNIMVTAQGHIFLIDFGIARFFKEGQEQDTTFLGSPGYAPPEQHGLSQTSPRSDLYGLGATLHYCLTGRDPYYARDRFSFPPIQHYNPQVPLELDQLIQRLVSHEERERPTSAREVRQALAQITTQATEHTTELAPSPSPAEQHTGGISAPRSFAPFSAAAQAQPVSAPFPSADQVQPPPMAFSPAAQAQPAQPFSSSVQSPPPFSPAAQQSSPMPFLPTAQQQSPPLPAVSRSKGRVQPARSFPKPSSTGSASLWTLPFILLFALVLIVTVASSAFVMQVLYIPSQYGFAFILEAALALLLAVIAGVGVTMVSNFIARGILSLTGLLSLIVGIAAVSMGLSANPLASLATLVGYDLRDATFIYGLIAVSVVSLLWLLRPLAWLYRGILLILFGGVLVLLFNQPSANDISTVSHTVPLVALIVLIQSVMLAIQAERTQR